MHDTPRVPETQLSGAVRYETPLWVGTLEASSQKRLTASYTRKLSPKASVGALVRCDLSDPAASVFKFGYDYRMSYAPLALQSRVRGTIELGRAANRVACAFEERITEQSTFLLHGELVYGDQPQYKLRLCDVWAWASSSLTVLSISCVHLGSAWA